MIIIDAGHGGSDSGAVGNVLKLKEKDVNLKVSKLIINDLKSRGQKAMFTRDKDEYLSLSQRAKIANSNKADYFISIHCNSYSDVNSNGVETYTYLKVDNETTKFVNSVHKELVKSTVIRDRGIKKADFAVLRETSMPAILIELAFISNVEEEKLLSMDNWIEKVSKSIVDGIMANIGGSSIKTYDVTKKQFKIKDYKADVVETKGLLGNSIINRDKPNAMINLALYDMETKMNFMYLKNEGITHPNGYQGSNYGIGVRLDGSIIPCSWNEAKTNKDIKDFASASPTLIYGGKKCIDWGTLNSSYLKNNAHYRMMVGFDKENVYMCMCNEKMTIEECYNYCNSQGFTDAFVYDGNGSQYLYTDNKTIKNSTRENVTWLQLFKKEVDKVNEVIIYCNGKELKGVLIDGKTQAPVRELAELLGKKVDFVNGKVYIN